MAKRDAEHAWLHFGELGLIFGTHSLLRARLGAIIDLGLTPALHQLWSPIFINQLIRDEMENASRQD